MKGIPSHEKREILARALLDGLTVTEAAKRAGYARPYASGLQKRPDFLALMERIQREDAGLPPLPSGESPLEEPPAKPAAAASPPPAPRPRVVETEARAFVRAALATLEAIHQDKDVAPKERIAAADKIIQRLGPRSVMGPAPAPATPKDPQPRPKSDPAPAAAPEGPALSQEEVRRRLRIAP